jgi:integrase
VKRRRVPKRHYEILRREEVAPVLASFPEPKLGSPWRWAAAVCLYVGARPGEAMGLWKVDVDTEEWVLAIRRSWGKPLPKDNEPRAVLIPTELRPVLLAAMRSSPNHLVFPRSNGEVFDPETAPRARGSSTARVREGRGSRRLRPHLPPLQGQDDARN